MKQITMTMGLIVLALSLTACAKNECEEQIDRAENRADECNLPINGGADDAAEECAEVEAVSFKCQADCADDAPCAGIDGSDEDASNVFRACISSCR